MVLGELREALGRLQFIAGPLEHLRPFLGSLYAWSCAGNRFLKPRLPIMLLLISKLIFDELGRGRMSSCRGSTTDLGELLRLDVKAEGDDVGEIDEIGKDEGPLDLAGLQNRRISYAHQGLGLKW